MPWKETKVIEESINFIAALKSGNWCFADLCIDFNISRKTGYKYLKNYEYEGIEGLKNKSSKRITLSNASSEKVVRLILDLREEHPSLGSQKLRPNIKASFHRQKRILIETTIGNILRKKGINKHKKKRQRVPQSLFPFSDVVAPNDVWCVDFKLDFTV
nr:leucine zipper domain-containing protein [Leptospira levettii]